MTAAVLLSVGAHATFLLAFNTKAAPRKTDVRLDKTAIMEVFISPVDELPPPPAQNAPKAGEQSNDQASSNAASLPEPISTTVISDITTVLTPSAPVPPHFEGNIWVVPTTQMRSHSGELADSRVFDVSELDRKPEALSQLQPMYPLELRRKNITGVVVVTFIVTSRGEVVQPEIVSSPDPLLSAAVTKALEKWRFRAGVKNGRNVSSTMEIPIQFRLD